MGLWQRGFRSGAEREPGTRWHGVSVWVSAVLKLDRLLTFRDTLPKVAAAGRGRGRGRDRRGRRRCRRRRGRPSLCTEHLSSPSTTIYHLPS